MCFYFFSFLLFQLLLMFFFRCGVQSGKDCFRRQRMLAIVSFISTDIIVFHNGITISYNVSPAIHIPSLVCPPSLCFAPRFGLFVAFENIALIGTKREENLIAFSMRFEVEFNFFFAQAIAAFIIVVQIALNHSCPLQLQSVFRGMASGV